MKSIDLIYIIPVTLSVLSFIVVFIYGKKIKNYSNRNDKIYIKYLPLLSITSLIIGVLAITYYYENQITIEKEKFNILQMHEFVNDSIYLNRSSKTKAVDSLINLDKKLNRLLQEVKKQEKITGENSSLKAKIEDKITLTHQEIGEINSYNEIIDIPKNVSKGYTASGNTSNFIFYCPEDSISSYLDLKLRFIDENLVDKIECIYLEVIEVKDNKNWFVFAQAFKPKKGINAFKMKNYLINKNGYFVIGYFLKSEANKEYPSFEKVTCK